MFDQHSNYLYRAVAIVICLFGVQVLTPNAYAQLGLGLTPMRVELRMAPEQEYSSTVKLSSQSGVRTRVRVEVLDFDIDETATPQFERELPKEEATSCKNWLTLNPMEMEIDSDGYLTVRYTIHLPAEIPEGSYNCAAGFTTLPVPSKENAGMGLSMAVRVVVSFYIVVGKPDISGTLEEITLEPMSTAKNPDGGYRAVVVMNNPGKMYYRPTGKLDVFDANGRDIESMDFETLPVLRERKQRFLFPLKTHLDPGQYKLRVRVDIGTGEVQEGTADVTVDVPAPSQNGLKSSFNAPQKD